MERIAIIGVAQTKYQRNSPSSHDEMAFEVAQKALEDAGLSIEDIDNTVTCTNDFWDGRTISCMTITDASGSSKVPTTNVEGDGTLGVLMGLMRILSGHFKTTLVVAQSKGSVGIPGLITNAIFDPLYERILGLDGINSAALQDCEPLIERDFYGGAIGGLASQYSAYMDKYGATEEDAALVSVRDRCNAALYNPYAHLRKTVTVGDVMSSPYIAYPLRLLHMCPRSDGACAVIFAGEEKAKKITDRPAWVLGVGSSHGATYLGDAIAIPGLPSLEKASRDAYKMAGITNPFKQIDVAELYLPAASAGVAWMESMGFCEEGGGPKFIKSGVINMDGELPINPSGGVIATNCIGATGLIRIGEAALQVMGKAEKRQVPGAKVALATGFGGCFWSDVTILCSQPRLD